MVSRGVARHVLLFGGGAGVLIAAMQFAEYRFLVVEHSIEIYVAIVASAFAAAGIWLGLKIVKPKVVVERVAVEVPVEVRVPVEVPVPVPAGSNPASTQGGGPSRVSETGWPTGMCISLAVLK